MPEPAAAIAILAFMAAGILAHAASAPPDALPVDADPALFSGSRARASLARILDDEAPHPVGSSAHAAVLERVAAELRAIGVEPEVHESLVVGRSGIVTRVHNLFATIPGRVDSPRTALAAPRIALAAHHDSVAAGPGAADDGAGVAAAIECVRALRAGTPLEHTLLLAITDGEEVDLSGACALVRELPAARDVRAVVNLEARGTSGLAFLFQTGPGVGDALARFGDLAERPSTSSIAALVYDRLPNDTDLSVFLNAGWTGLNFAFIGDFRRYHTPRDDLAHLDTRSLQHLGEGALAGLRALDGLDLAVAHDERPGRVWHDVLGRGVIGWPRNWSVPLALAALALVSLGARRHRASLREIVFGATGAALGILVSALVLWGFARAQSALHGASDPWFAFMNAWNATSLLAGLFGAATGALFARSRSVRAESAFLGVWIPFALVAVLVAALEPAACLLFVVPSLAAGIAVWFLPARAQRASTPFTSTGFAGTPLTNTARLAAITLIPFAACALFWLPFLLGVTAALGFAAGFVPGALTGTAAVTLVPLLVVDRARRIALGLGALLVVAFFFLARAPDRTPDAPIWTNVAHVQSQDRADWAIATYGAELPELTVGTEVELARLLPWARWLPTAHIATAPRHEEPAPRAEVTVLEESDIHRRLRVKLMSPRGATTFVLGFPEGKIEVEAIRSGDLFARGRLPSSSPLTFVGIGPEGVELEVVVLDRSEWRFDLADARSGLPLGIARPFAPEATRVPRGRGDVSISATTFAR